MSKNILIDTTNNIETRIAVTEDGKLDDNDQIIFYGEKKFHSKAIAGPAFENEKLADYFCS